MSNELINHIDMLHTTKLGAERIKRNLGLTADDVVHWCKQKVLQADEIIRKGKNWYVYAGEAVITVNAYSCTIITAHRSEENPSFSVKIPANTDKTMEIKSVRETYAREELQEALRSIQSTIGKGEKVLLKLREGTSQHTLTTRRVKALQIAITLITRELEDVYGKENP